MTPPAGSWASGWKIRTTVPISTSIRLKQLRPSLVTLARFPGAGHVESWNIDRARYTSLLESFLSPVAP